MLRLYRTLVRPLLEYFVRFWSPCYRKDIIKLESVQKRFTRMLPGMDGMSYKERLDRLGHVSLEYKRLRDDLVEAYKIMKGIDRDLNPGPRNITWVSGLIVQRKYNSAIPFPQEPSQSDFVPTSIYQFDFGIPIVLVLAKREFLANQKPHTSPVLTVPLGPVVIASTTMGPSDRVTTGTWAERRQVGAYADQS
eukprot:g45727.t1